MHSFQQLVRLFEEKFNPVTQISKEPQSLYEPCTYFLNIGGKRIRPVACLMGNELFSGTIQDNAWHAATAIELFHNFTLVHDDIMDKAPLRRGKATVHEKYGLTSGILSGDALVILAYQELAKINQPLQGLLELFNRTALEVCEGQQWDMDFENRNDVSIEAYINMISLKTSVLLAASLKMGALLCNPRAEDAHMLYNFGKNLGIAFQLQDDYLDAFGAPEKLGKQQGGDIISNKKTYLLLSALQDADAVARAEITGLYSHSDTGYKVKRMLELFAATAADKKILQAVESYSNAAFEALNAIEVPEANKTPLRNLAQWLLQREY